MQPPRFRSEVAWDREVAWNAPRSSQASRWFVVAWLQKLSFATCPKTLKFLYQKYVKSTTFGRSGCSVLQAAFVTSVPLGGRPCVATSEVGSAVSVLRLREFASKCLMLVDDLFLRICES